MQELDDIALLRQFTEQNSEEAFAALVSRHVNKVYSVALRHTRNPHQAEEITQAVFVILANKARYLGKSVVLSGWLYQTARLTAMTFIRSEIRRTHREQEAHMQTLLNENESDVWPQIAPLLDAAMAGLSETDRHAVVLRFFDGKSMKEVGAVLGASEEAIKMRVNRAVEKLRRFFTKHGVVMPAAILTAAISANSAQAAPEVLAKSVSAIAIAKGATASGSTLALVKGTLSVMAWTKAKIVAAGVAALFIGATSASIVLSKINSSPPVLPGFGLVLERVINTDDPIKFGNNYIDFDTGAQPARPDNARTDTMGWMGKNGVDALDQILSWKEGNRTQVAPGMMGFDMVAVPIESKLWNTITPAEIRNRLAAVQPDSSGLAVIGGKGDLPLTYLFKTREGGMGILQITGYTDPQGRLGIHPRGAAFHYKLLQK